MIIENIELRISPQALEDLCTELPVFCISKAFAGPDQKTCQRNLPLPAIFKVSLHTVFDSSRCYRSRRTSKRQITQWGLRYLAKELALGQRMIRLASHEEVLMNWAGGATHCVLDQARALLIIVIDSYRNYMFAINALHAILKV